MKSKAKSSNVMENEVENFLRENKGKKLSLRKIYKDLHIKRRKAIWLIHMSKNIIKVDPLTVGSNAHFLHVYTYVE